MAQRQPIRKPQSEIPDKLYFRIGEVSRLCEVAAYVLRFWETEFSQLRPHKGGTGQRLYRRRDVETAIRIKGLLYDEGYTIPGARQILKNQQKSKAPQMQLAVRGPLPPEARQHLESLRSDLQGLLGLVSAISPATPAPSPYLPRSPRPRSVPQFTSTSGPRPAPLFDPPDDTQASTSDLPFPQRDSGLASESAHRKSKEL